MLFSHTTNHKKAIDIASLYLLYGVALFYFSIPALGETLYKMYVVLLLILIPYHEYKNWKSPPYLLFILSILIQLASWLYSNHFYPEYAEASFKPQKLSSIFLFIMIGWTLERNQKAPWELFTLSFLGLLLTFLIHGESIFDGFHSRAKLGFHNSQHSAMLFSLSAIIIATFFARAIKSTRRSNYIAFLTLTTSLTLCLLAVAVTSTRAAALGLITAFIAAFIFIFTQNKIANRTHALLAFASAGCILFLVWNTTTIQQRWERESDSVQHLLNRDISKISNTSNFGIRLYGWIESTNWIKESPIFGWGGSGRKHVVQNATTLPEKAKKNIRHLHNSFFDTLVNYGILGLLLLFATYSWIIKESILAYKKRLVEPDIAVCVVAFFSFWFTTNLFESYLYYDSGKLAFATIIGGILSFQSLRAKQETPT